jgi:hypothetical protein
MARDDGPLTISLARTDGARKDILELCTHTPRKSGNTIDLYTTFPWEALCAEVVKLKVQRHERGQLARLALAASAEKENPGSPDGDRGVATSLATVSRKAESFPGDTEWRRRESKPLRADPPPLGTRGSSPVSSLKMGRPSVRASPGAFVRFGPFLVPLDPSRS